MQSLAEQLDAMMAEHKARMSVDYRTALRVQTVLEQADKQLLDTLHQTIRDCEMRRNDIIYLAYRLHALVVGPPRQQEPPPIEREPYTAPRYLQNADQLFSDLYQGGPPN